MLHRLPVAKEGFPFLIGCVLAGLAACLVGFYAGFFFFLLAAVTAFFFRDPERHIVFSDHLILSPADGRIVDISQIKVPEFGECLYLRVSIFLSILDVHITRAPIRARVEKIVYSKGCFRWAFQKEALDQNENNLIFLKNPRFTIGVRQIAGKIARKIVCYCQEGQSLAQGQRMGLIKFGSCVQIYLPKEVSSEVSVGQKVKAGLTIIGSLP